MDKSTWHVFQENIILKVCDFGTAASPGIAPESLLRGSCRHYAPEALQSKANYTEKSDVFMFGVALYEFFHRKKFWQGKTTSEATEKTLEGVRPELNIEGPLSEAI